jgi:hypothetical protein
MHYECMIVLLHTEVANIKQNILRASTPVLPSHIPHVPLLVQRAENILSTPTVLPDQVPSET